jgi:hypothetical protein
MTDQKPTPEHAGAMDVKSSGPKFWRIVCGDTPSAVLVKDGDGKDITESVIGVRVTLTPGSLTTATITTLATVDLDVIVDDSDATGTP